MCITDVPDLKILGIQYHSIRTTNVRTTSPITMNQRVGARNMSEGFVCPEYGPLCTCIPTPPDIVIRANFADHSNTKRRFSTTNSWFVGHGDIAFRLPSQLFVRPCAARSRPRWNGTTCSLVRNSYPARPQLAKDDSYCAYDAPTSKTHWNCEETRAATGNCVFVSKLYATFRVTYGMQQVTLNVTSSIDICNELVGLFDGSTLWADAPLKTGPKFGGI